MSHKNSKQTPQMNTADSTQQHMQQNGMQSNMMTQSGIQGMQSSQQQQAIKCTVTSCHHNQGASHCNLQSIQVSPCNNVATGCAEDESNCASYQQR